MKISFKFLINRSADLSRLIIFLAGVVLLTWMFPKSGKLKYEYEIGVPWRYAELTAPFDFAIQKSVEEIEAEKYKILSSTQPHFVIDEQVKPIGLQKFDDLFQRSFRNLKNDSSLRALDSLYQLTEGKNILSKCFDQVLVEVPLEERFEKLDELILVRQNNAMRTKLADVISSREQAVEALVSELKKDQLLNQRLLLPILRKSLSFNAFHDDSLTLQMVAQKVDKINLSRGVVRNGETIIRKGDIVTSEKFLKIQSFESEYVTRIGKGRQANIIGLGYFILITICFLIFLTYLLLFKYKEIRRPTDTLLIVGMITSIVSLIILVSANKQEWLYAVPICIVPIILRTFYGPTLAIHAHLVIVLLASLVTQLGLGFTFIQLTAGIVAILSNRSSRYLSEFLRSCVLVVLTYIVGFVALGLVQSGQFSMDYGQLSMLAVNGLLTLLAFPLIPVFERMVGRITDVSLVELADLNRPLLKKLSIETPGTFQHSLQVANLADAAASAIRANSLLVKVGALYHDVGKMDMPALFIENQVPGMNPHDGLEPLQSAKIIIAHVTTGVKMAKKHRLPDTIIDFIRTHHGRSRVEYFYRKHLELHPDYTDEEQFRYPGPLPYSKETAILMMADSVEAASRSLRNPTKANLEKLVDQLIDKQIEQQQFAVCDLSFKEISKCKQVFKKMLASIYHLRIEYPAEVQKA